MPTDTTILAGIEVPSTSPVFLTVVGFHVVVGTRLRRHWRHCYVESKTPLPSSEVPDGLLLVLVCCVPVGHCFVDGSLG